LVPIAPDGGTVPDRVRALRIVPLVLIAVAAAGDQSGASVRCARDGLVRVRAPHGVRTAAVYVSGHRRGTVRRGRPRWIRVSAPVTIRLVGRTRSGRRVRRRIRARVCEAPPPPPGFITPGDPRLRYEGRWDVGTDHATTVNSGARVFLRFTGAAVAASFDIAGITQPPQIYVWVDGRRSAVRKVDRRRLELTPDGLASGTHTLVLALKDVSQDANRWRPPLASGLRLAGFDLEGGALEQPPPPPDVRFTFLGDSITQGVASRCVVEPDQVESSPGAPTASDCADATLDYAWRVAGEFGAQLEQVGFGGQGVTTAGAGHVPPAPQSLDWNFADSPAAPFDAHVVVINQGTNDFLDNVPRAQIQAAYLDLLRRVRARYPDARIIALAIFGAAGGTETGDVNAAIRGAVFQMGDLRTTYVPTRNWLTPVADFSDSIHPNDGGHRKVTEHLAQAITNLTGLRRVAPLDAPPG
jgi:lysophospholipase L1-like esterase